MIIQFTLCHILLAQAWWRAKVDEIYSLLPGFGGFLVKADSEGNAGPQTYNRTEAEVRFEESTIVNYIYVGTNNKKSSERGTYSLTM